MVFLTVMYDTAARCQELIDLRIQDLSLMHTEPCVYLTGKGNKTRVVPLLPKTAQHLKNYLDKFHPEDVREQTDYVFYTHSGPQKRMSAVLNPIWDLNGKEAIRKLAGLK